MDSQKIGQYLTAKRKAAGLTQAELAQRLHLTRQAVSKWEAGKSVPDTPTLLELAGIYGVTVEKILDGGDSSAAGGPSSDPPPAVPMAPPAAYIPGEAPPVPAGRPAPACPTFRQAAGWLLWLPAAVLAVLFVLIPLGKTAFFSFTDFNVLEAPDFVGMRNFVNCWQDELFRRAAQNTVVILLLAGGGTLLLGWLFGHAASRLPLPIGLAAGLLLGLGSLSVLTPGWLGYVFSGDRYGLLNGWLLSAGIIQDPVMWASPQHANALQIAILFCICLGPSYFLFYLGGRMGKDRAAWHMGVTLIPLFLLAAWQAPVSVTGFPSTDYSAHWLPSMLYDYGSIRFEIGVSCALFVMLLGILAAWMVQGHLLVWAGHLLANALRKGRRPACGARPWHWCAGFFGLLASLGAFFPPLVLLAGTTKPLAELFIFPPRFFAGNPTAEPLRQAFTLSRPWLEELPLFLLAAIVGYIVVVLPTAAALAFFRGRGARVAAVAWLGASLLMPLLLMASFPLSPFPSLFYVPSTGSTFWMYLAAYIYSPLLPLNTLLSASLMRRCVQGSADFSSCLRSRKRGTAFAVAALFAGASSTLSLLYALNPEGCSLVRTLTGLLSGGGVTRVNVACALGLILLAAGVFFLFLMLPAVAAARMASHPPRKRQTGDRKPPADMPDPTF
ncbi:MAG TPA: helix-turn-helix domain-containing protein [Firmicutes bacterium]|nr:helix-turn-helix domain-containing protein [Bacillota bacterium]